MHSLLSSLRLGTVNPGVYTGDGWSAGGAPFSSVSPIDGATIASIGAANAADLQHVLASATAAAERWRQIPAPQRGEAIRRVGAELRRHKETLGRLISTENGKILVEALGEVQEMIDIADFAVGQSRMLYGLTMHSERPDHRMYEQWHPLGVVGVITAFNFPVAVWAWNAFLGAVAGNVIVWKPSPKTALCAIAVQKIASDVFDALGLPAVFQMFVEPGHELTEALVADGRVPLISFTGSTAVGRRIAVAVAARLGRSLLELGGNNGLIVDEFANLDLAVPSIVFGAIGTAGQRCTTTRRVIVHESRAEELERRLARAYGQIRIGNPLDPHHLMGPLIDQAAVARYEATIARVRAAGGELLYGAEVLAGPGHYVRPTLFRAEPDWEVVREETFAPILYLHRYRTLEQALAICNSTAYGLSSAIFTDRLQHAERFLSAAGSDCGIANVNIGTSGAEIGGAFGGEKDTGGGRESGSDVWKTYMRRQTTTINYGDSLPLAQGIRFDLQ